MCALRVMSLEEVEEHNTSDSVWMVIHGNVYDVTAFLSEHPGGEDVLMDYAGQEASEAFDEVGHSNDAKLLMKKYQIGTTKKECKHCDTVKKYLPYGAAVLAVAIVLGIVILRSRS